MFSILAFAGSSASIHALRLERTPEAGPMWIIGARQAGRQEELTEQVQHAE
jgi:hypothetical protein